MSKVDGFEFGAHTMSVHLCNCILSNENPDDGLRPLLDPKERGGGLVNGPWPPLKPRIVSLDTPKGPNFGPFFLENIMFLRFFARFNHPKRWSNIRVK